MDNKWDYYKEFLLFNEEDKGFSERGNISGHSKIEVRNGRGEINLIVQNISNKLNNFEYKVYLMKNKNDDFKNIFLGNLKIQGSIGRLSYEFSPENVNMSGENIKEFNIIAVVVQIKNDEGIQILAPVVAYKNKNILWKHKLKKELEKNIISQESKILSQMQEDKVDICEITNKGEKEEEQNKEEQGEEKDEKEETDKEVMGKISLESTQKKEETSLKKEAKKEWEKEYKNLKTSTVRGSGEKKDYRILNKYYLNKYCPIINRGGAVQANNSPCKICTYNNCLALEKLINKFDIDVFKRQIDFNFKRCEPFANKRRDYIWWDVPDINKLYIIMNLFHLRVKKVDYVEKKSILGIYEDFNKIRRYVILGIPLNDNTSQNQFDKIVKRRNAEDNCCAYGLIFIDPYKSDSISI